MTSQVTLSSRRGQEARERLIRALINAAAAGQRTHCSDPGSSELWLSEREEERAEAARLCVGCPVLEPCGQVGQHERFGVWGSVDKTPRPYKINKDTPDQDQ
jgi:hypothetical protein